MLVAKRDSQRVKIVSSFWIPIEIYIIMNANKEIGLYLSNITLPIITNILYILQSGRLNFV